MSWLIIRLTLISFLIISVIAKPSKYKYHQSPTKNCSTSDRADDIENDDAHDTYDQRQNGTENYRISVKDFVLLWAPSDLLLTAAALFDSQLFGDDLFNPEDIPNFELPQEVEKNETETDSKPNLSEDDKVVINSEAQKPISSKRYKFRFPSLALPALKKP